MKKNFIQKNKCTEIAVLILFISIYGFGFAQNPIKFVIVDENKHPISYANVYGKLSHKGAYSNLNGKVNFTDIPILDTLVISCVGYTTREIQILNLRDTVVLKVFSNELQVFTVKSDYEKETIGIKRRNFLVFHSEGRYAGSVNGIVFSAKTESFLESVSLFIDKPEDSSRTKFLLMVYSVEDSTSFPLDPILSQQLFFDVSEKGWSKIELDSFRIPLSGMFYIGIETVPNFDFEDSPKYFEWASKSTATYRSVSFLFKELPYTWVWGYAGERYFYGMDGTENGAHNNFPLIKATIKY